MASATLRFASSCALAWFLICVITPAQVPGDTVGRRFTELNDKFWSSADTFSLKVEIKGGTRSQHFRLLGLNAPEPDDTRSEDLIQDCARFRLPRAEVLAWGERARQAVQTALQSGGTVFTERTPAGVLNERRYVYAVVHDSQGRDLAAFLIHAGLAVAEPPLQPAPAVSSSTPSAVVPDLLRLQNAAMRSGRGIWSQARAVIPALPVPAQAAVADQVPQLNGQTWTVYREGVPAPGFYHGDGDSFALSAIRTGATRRSTRIWRLYGVDCPETDLLIPERVRTQAKYFGVSTTAITKWGNRAAEFQQRFLARGPATVYTVHEDARGTTAKGRHYALVFVNGNDLALALVREGLALAGSMRLPGESRQAASYHRTLSNAEREAKAARRGIWQDAAE